MKAASVAGKGKIQIEELPRPEPGPGMALLKVIYCSICGSEIERVYDLQWNTATEQQLAGIRGTILGHEYVARVEALGEGAAGLSVGDRVVGIHLPCGHCYYCRRGLSDLCMGGRTRGHPYDGTSHGSGVARYGAMAEYIIRSTRHEFKVPDNISDEEAAMTEPLATGVAAVHSAGVKIGDSVVVIGVGHIGLCVLAAAKAAGAAPLIAVDMNPSRLNVALEMGANIALLGSPSARKGRNTENPNDTDIIQTVVDITEAGPDITFVCVSSRAPGVLGQAFEMVRREGRVIIVGNAASEALPAGKWLTKEVRVEGVVHMGEKTVPALKLMEYNRVNIKPMITEIIPLEEAQRAFDSLREAKNIGVLLKP